MPLGNVRWYGDRISREVKDASSKALIKVAELVYNKSQEPGYVPVKSGHLKSSALIDIISDDEAEVAYQALYAEAVEFGEVITGKDGKTITTKPHLFLQRAVNDVESQIESEFAKGVQDALPSRYL